MAMFPAATGFGSEPAGSTDVSCPTPAAAGRCSGSLARRRPCWWASCTMTLCSATSPPAPRACRDPRSLRRADLQRGRPVTDQLIKHRHLLVLGCMRDQADEPAKAML